MKYKKYRALILFLIININLSAAITDIRIAYINPNDNLGTISPYTTLKAIIPEEFLQRAKSNNYTHIMVQYYLNESYCERGDWHNGKYRGGTGIDGSFNSGGLYNVIKSHLDLVVNKYGLQFIPSIGVGCTGTTWVGIPNDNDLSGTMGANPNMDLYALNTGTDGVGIPCIAPGQSNGFDTTFKHFVSVLNAACNDIGYNLPYINLGYSEAFMDHNATIGSTTYNTGHIIYGTPASNGSGGTKTSIDQIWLSNHQQDTTALVIASLRKRLETLRSLAGTNRFASTKLLIYGDLFSDEFQKACDKINPSGNNTFDTLPTVDLPSRMPQSLKDSIIIMPWWYEEAYQTIPDYYNNENEFKHFTDNGIKIIYIRCLADNDTTDLTILNSRIKQLRNSINAVKNHSNNALIIGYCAAHWNRYAYSNTGLTWNAMEFMAYGNQVARPNIRFSRIPQGTLNGAAILPLLCSQTEVTQGDYYATTGKFPFFYDSTGNLNFPTENVTFYDAILYCNARSLREGLKPVYSYDSPQFNGDVCTSISNLSADTSKSGYRLPSPEEWEYIYMAGTITDYYWGFNTIGLYCWYYNNSSNKTQPVSQKLPNAFGIYDIAGNIWEWTCKYDGTFISGLSGGCYTNTISEPYFKHNGYIIINNEGLRERTNGFRIVRKEPPDLSPIINLLLD
jgi:hypothetical protein